MNNHIFTRDEFIARFKLEEASLREWERTKLLKPVGFTEDRVPLYSEEVMERIGYIQKLTDLGYETEDIQKILKKVGLPKTAERKRKPEDPDQYLTIGNLAERVGLSPRTIKHWEDKGIIEPDMRSEGGFRLYSGGYIYLCELIRDLQLFGYTLEEIKEISDYFRYFLAIQENLGGFPKAEVSTKLEAMLMEIKVVLDKMEILDKGIKRWEDLLKKKRKEILSLKAKNLKRDGKKKQERVK
ncbi:MAG TPA: MerR family transcriptional regulator [Candidatus Desulfaltia sp.]|nr:MerR family transcriptional regulator [Candidatus Desulfaltia sp.]